MREIQIVTRTAYVGAGGSEHETEEAARRSFFVSDLERFLERTAGPSRDADFQAAAEALLKLLPDAALAELEQRLAQNGRMP